MSQPTQHQHSKFLTPNRINAPIEVSYTTYAYVEQPWDLEKIQADPDSECWIKWNTLYVLIGKEENLPVDDVGIYSGSPSGDGTSVLYQYYLSDPGEGGEDYKRPNESDVEDWLGNGEHRQDGLECEDDDHLPNLDNEGGLYSVLISRHDLIPRCETCEEKLGRYHTPERRIAGEKITSWCKEKLYNPHTKIGKRFAETQIAWAFDDESFALGESNAEHDTRLWEKQFEVPTCRLYLANCKNPCAEKLLANGRFDGDYWDMCDSCMLAEAEAHNEVSDDEMPEEWTERLNRHLQGEVVGVGPDLFDAFIAQRLEQQVFANGAEGLNAFAKALWDSIPEDFEAEEEPDPDCDHKSAECKCDLDDSAFRGE